MIEAYAFLAAFTVQILVISVLHPAWVIRYGRAKSETWFTDPRYAQLYPGWDRAFAERFRFWYRIANIVIAALGLGLLVWLFRFMQGADWNVALVRPLLAAYVTLQIAPFVFIGLIGLWVNRKALQLAPPQPIRTASLQRRGLFDFVSPWTVAVAALAYILFTAALLYIWQHPVPGFNYPMRPLTFVTFTYIWTGLFVYRLLHGRKNTPLETRADRAHQAAIGIKVGFYISIATVVYLSINITLEELLGNDRWVPAVLSVFMASIWLISSRNLLALPRPPETTGRAPQNEVTS